MLNVILHRPEIPPNTGNVMRLCANTGATLHLVEPLGFTLETKALRRAGLDYRDLADVHVHRNLGLCLDAIADRRRAAPSTQDADPARLFALSTRGRRGPAEVDWRAGDIALFGSESRGLPDDVLDDPGVHDRLRIPMRAHNRSLNLSNAVAVVVYEAWRQLGYAGAPGP